MNNKGLIQIYTGCGKGKTTASVGLVCRALGYGLKVCYINFHKDIGASDYGELKSLKKLGADIIAFVGKHPCHCKDADLKKIRQDCLSALQKVKDIFKKNEYDMLILDEINICIRDNFLTVKEVIDLIELKPEKLELILTGRDAVPELIEKADLVSEIKNIKHPYDKGILARKGVEY